MGRPGPMDMIPEYIKRRDDPKQEWKKGEDPRIIDILGETFGVICYHGDTLLSMADGSHKRIIDINNGEVVQSLNSENRIIHNKVDCHAETVFGDGLEVILENGLSLTTTANHKYITFNNKRVEAKDLKLGDLIAVPIKTYDNANKKKLASWLGSNTDVAYLIGHLVGDGCLTSSSLAIAAGSKLDAHKLQKWINVKLPKIKTRIYKHCRCYYVGISCGELIIKKKKTKFHDLIEKLNLNCNVHKKRIPINISSSTIKVKSAFLAGLIDSDGCVSINGNGVAAVYISSCNKLLLQDIHRLCVSLGVISAINDTKIYMWNTKHVNNLCKDFLLKKINGKLYDANTVGYAPKTVLFDKIKESGLSQRKFCTKFGINRKNLQHQSDVIRTSIAMTIGVEFGDVRYYKIKKINHVKNVQFYNLSVSPDHTVIANGIATQQCYQEQLSATWIKLARFSLVEAEEARKIVSKKWIEKLPQIEKKWKSGASNVIGEQAANAWWEKMVFFGRYCFNKSHALAYSLITYRCLYLKAHYPAEWWAAVMTECHRDKLGHYMSAAKLDGVEFGTIDINNLTQEFTVLNGRVIPGLKAVKGVGGKAAEAFTKIPGPFINIDDMISKCGKHKIVFERLIKLGAFDKLHSNRRGLWVWYKYKYCSGSDIRELKKQVDLEFAWPEQDVLNRRVKLIAEYKQLNPKKKKIPVGLLKWRPKPILTREQVINLFNDYDISERLVIEKNMLGYYWSSPLLMYHTRGFTIKKAKEQSLASEEAIIVKIEAVVEKVETKRAKASGSFFYIMHLTDGVQVTDVVIWADVYNACDRRVFGDGAGVEVDVVYNKERESFRIANGSVVIPLLHKTVEIDDGVVINETVKKDLGEDLLW
jgi:intein/homing endonuclease